MDLYPNSKFNPTPYKANSGTSYGAWKPSAGPPAQANGAAQSTRGFNSWENAPAQNSAGKQTMFNDVNAKQYLTPGKYGPGAQQQAVGYGVATGQQPTATQPTATQPTATQPTATQPAAQPAKPDYSIQGQLDMFQKMRPAKPPTQSQQQAAQNQGAQQQGQQNPNDMWNNLAQRIQKQMEQYANRKSYGSSHWAQDPFGNMNVSM